MMPEPVSAARGIRVLFVNEPRLYREVISDALRLEMPGAEVVVADPSELDREMERLQPDLVVCSQVTPRVRDSVPVWIELYPEEDAISVVSFEGRRLEVHNIEFDGLISLVDVACRLVRME
jgi:chemotaxis response regulator CheB